MTQLEALRLLRRKIAYSVNWLPASAHGLDAEGRPEAEITRRVVKRSTIGALLVVCKEAGLTSLLVTRDLEKELDRPLYDATITHRQTINAIERLIAYHERQHETRGAA